MASSALWPSGTPHRAPHGKFAARADSAPPCARGTMEGPAQHLHSQFASWPSNHPAPASRQSFFVHRCSAVAPLRSFLAWPAASKPPSLWFRITAKQPCAGPIDDRPKALTPANSQTAVLLPAG